MLKLNNYFDIKWLIFAFLVIAIVLTFTHIPQERMPSQMQQNGLDKILHILAYGTIAFCLILSFQKPPSKYTAVIVFCFLLTIGIIDESTQPLVNRHASLADLLADTFGILTVLLFFLITKKQFQKIKVAFVSRLLFMVLVTFITSISVITTVVLSLNKLNESNLRQQQKEVRYFFYNTMYKLFENTYYSEEGVISQQALETFKKYKPQLGSKCQLFICDDSYNRKLQTTGKFNCMVFFPSGNIFYTTIVRSEKNLQLKSLTPGNWETEWMEIMREIKQH